MHFFFCRPDIYRSCSCWFTDLWKSTIVLKFRHIHHIFFIGSISKKCFTGFLLFWFHYFRYIRRQLHQWIYFCEYFCAEQNLQNSKVCNYYLFAQLLQGLLFPSLKLTCTSVFLYDLFWIYSFVCVTIIRSGRIFSFFNGVFRRVISMSLGRALRIIIFVESTGPAGISWTMNSIPYN